MTSNTISNLHRSRPWLSRPSNTRGWGEGGGRYTVTQLAVLRASRTRTTYLVRESTLTINDLQNGAQEEIHNQQSLTDRLRKSGRSYRACGQGERVSQTTDTKAPEHHVKAPSQGVQDVPGFTPSRRSQDLLHDECVAIFSTPSWRRQTETT